MTMIPGAAEPVGMADRAERSRLAYGRYPLLSPQAADSPEALKAQLEATLGALPAEVLELFENFAPRTMAPTDWARVKEFVTAAMLATTPLNRHTFQQLSAAVVSLTSWAHLEQGFPLKYRLLLSADVVTKWQQDEVRTHRLSEGTVRNYRGHIARISHVLGVQPNSRFDPIHRITRLTPYSEQELDAIWLWTRTLTPRSRHRAQVTVALAAGAGLRLWEIGDVRAKNVISEAGMWVRTGEPSARMVPVLAKWRPKIRTLVSDLRGGDHLYGRPKGSKANLNLLSRQSTPSRFSGPVRPDRLRASWIVEMLRSEADDAATLAYSGIERGETLARYLPFLGDVDAARRTALIRMHPARGNAAHRGSRGHLLDNSRSTAEAGGNND